MAIERTPWRTLDVRTVDENDRIEVSHREVVAPTGPAGVRGLVHVRDLAIGRTAGDPEPGRRPSLSPGRSSRADAAPA